MRHNDKEIAAVFKALSDENRVQILRLLRNGERCACHLLEKMQLSQPTLSHHMKILCDSGLVAGRKEGKWMYYTISLSGSKIAIEGLQELTATANSKCECCKK